MGGGGAKPPPRPPQREGEMAFEFKDSDMEIDYEELLLCLLMGMCDMTLDELKHRAIEPDFAIPENTSSSDWRYYVHVELGNKLSIRKWCSQKIEYRMCDVFISEMQAQAHRAHREMQAAREKP